MAGWLKMASFFKRKNRLFFEPVARPVAKFFSIYKASKKINMAKFFKMAFALFSCMKICFVTVLFGISNSFSGSLNIF
jgi:hypothetical protein